MSDEKGGNGDGAVPRDHFCVRGQTVATEPVRGVARNTKPPEVVDLPRAVWLRGLGYAECYTQAQTFWIDLIP